MNSDTSFSPSEPRPGADPCDTVGAWRDGEKLVIERGAALPQRCIVTNGPVAGFLTTRLYWHRPAWYLALVVVPGVYVIYLFVLASSIEATWGLSRGMLDRRRVTVIGAWGAFAAGLLTTFVAGRGSSSAWAITGLTLMLAGVAWWALGTRLLRVIRMESGYAWIKGVHPDYLTCLPTWAGPPNKRIEPTAQAPYHAKDA